MARAGGISSAAATARASSAHEMMVCACGDHGVRPEVWVKEFILCSMPELACKPADLSASAGPSQCTSG